VKCEHCGTAFRVPDDSASGGINITTSGGSVTIQGDLVAGNKIVTTSGISGAELIELFKQFQSIYRQIDARPEDSKVDREALKAAVRGIQQEVAQGERADPDKVERWLTFLAGMADDVFQVTVATLANPAVGVAKAIQLITQKAIESKRQAQTFAAKPASDLPPGGAPPIIEKTAAKSRGLIQPAAAASSSRGILDTFMRWLGLR
jgi:hypothetical protein